MIKRSLLGRSILFVKLAEIKKYAIISGSSAAKNSSSLPCRIYENASSFSKLPILEVSYKNLTFVAPKNAPSVWSLSPSENLPVVSTLDPIDSNLLDKSTFVLSWVDFLAHKHEDGLKLSGRYRNSLDHWWQGDSISAFVDLLYLKQLDRPHETKNERNRSRHIKKLSRR